MRPVLQTLTWTALAAVVSLTSSPRLAFAQDAATPAPPPAPPPPPATAPPTAAPPTAPPPPAHASLATPPALSNAPPNAEPKPATPANLSLGFVEQLPASGYPEPKVRGLKNGSLWLDMQGWQWPYYPKTGIAVSGYGWVDTSYISEPVVTGANGQPLSSDVGSRLFAQQARVLSRITPTWSNGDYFVQAQAELVATALSATSSGVLWSADDAWVRAGKWNLFDVQLGRFQMWEVYHFGMGLDLFTFERAGASGRGPSSNLIPDQYAETSIAQIFLRQNTIGEGAIHVYPLDWLRFELGGQYGPDSNGNNVWGLRPAAIADFGFLKFKGEIQYRDDKANQESGTKLDTNEVSGGGAVQLVLDPYIEGGFNFEYANQNATNAEGTKDAGGTRHQYTYGGFGNIRPGAFLPFVPSGILLGGGAHMTFSQTTNFDRTVGRNDEGDHLQVFGAAQYMLFDQLYIKLVVAYALGHSNPTRMTSPSVYQAEVLSGRLRLQYNF